MLNCIEPKSLSLTELSNNWLLFYTAKADLESSFKRFDLKNSMWEASHFGKREKIISCNPVIKSGFYYYSLKTKLV